MSDQCASPTIEERQADFIRAVKEGDRVTVSKVNAIGGWDSSHFNARDIQVCADELDRLRAENERLRDALIDAVDMLSGATFEVMRVRGQYIDRKDVVCRARAALKTDGSKE